MKTKTEKRFFKNLSIIMVVLVIILSLSACTIKTNENNSSPTSTQTSVTTSANTSVSVEYDEDDLNTSETNAEKITLNSTSISSSSSAVTVSGSTATITKGGTYVISGTLTDGQIIVNSTDENVVHIIFDNASINCSTSSPISVEQAKKVVITLKDSTENTITDSRAAATDTDDTDDDTPSAAIYSCDDLTINGNGTLTVNGNYKNGIQTKDELKLVSGNVNVTAVNDAIKGKDFVAVKDGVYTLTSTSGDAIQSTNSNTEGETVGFVLIDGGTFKITAAADGIKAESVVAISSGNFEITAGEDGIQGTTDVSITGGDFSITTTGNVAQSAQEDMPGGAMNNTRTPFTQNNTQSTTSNDDVAGDTVSSKGIKSDGTLSVSGGTITINTTGHSIHSIGEMNISGGTLKLNSSNGKGISAHENLTISNATIDITQSAEGIESKAVMTINSGTIHIVATDDGLNAGGDIAGVKQTFSSDSEATHQIVINGGYIYIDAAGDGVDSNGTVTINGGTVIVNGPTNDGNGALDSEQEIVVNGGTVIASGSTGMLETPATSSPQCTLAFGASLTADSIICIKDSNGNEVLTFSPSKQSASVVFSSAELKKGETYTVYSGGSYSGGSETDGVYTGGSYTGGSVLQTMTISSAVTSAGVSSSMGGGMMGGNQQMQSRNGNMQQPPTER
ncbi:MAG: carbohydrate-binding domain-containing protein [Clostridiales bacterium]|nr:carbohydrate-binding domain-containing protein [Clostridiales bacterium]